MTVLSFLIKHILGRLFDFLVNVITILSKGHAFVVANALILLFFVYFNFRV